MNKAQIEHIDFDLNHFRPQMAIEIFSTLNKQSEPFIAWIDTGATNTVFSKKVTERLDFMKVNGNEKIIGDTPGGNAEFILIRAKVKIIGTDKSQFIDGIDVFASSRYMDGFDILLGLDILSYATFTLDSANKKFCLEFKK